MKLVNAASRPNVELPDFGLALHLGCGKKRLEGFINVDYHDSEVADILVDLREPWPWMDNGVGLIVAHHVLEHLPDVVHFMDEAHRVLKPGGVLHVAVPHYLHENAWGDPTHVRAFSERTMDAFTDEAPHRVGSKWRIQDQWYEGGREPWLPGIIKAFLGRHGVQVRRNPGEIQWLMVPDKEGKWNQKQHW